MLARSGYQVLVTDVNDAGAQETADQIGGGAWAMAQDVRDPDSHRKVAAAAAERGPLKVWVNNAGSSRPRTRLGPPRRRRAHDGRGQPARRRLGSTRGRRGHAGHPEGAHIINMASMASFGPVPGLGVYGATKHGVLGLTESLQGDLAIGASRSACTRSARTWSTRDGARAPGGPGMAIIFSAPRLLQAGGRSQPPQWRSIDSTRIVEAIPRWRASTVRLRPGYQRAKPSAWLLAFAEVGERRSRQKEEAAG